MVVFNSTKKLPATKRDATFVKGDGCQKLSAQYHGVVS